MSRVTLSEVLRAVRLRGAVFYLVDGSAIWYSLPYQYENFRFDAGYLPMPGTVRVAVPLTTGIWVGTEEEFFFMQGRDPAVEGGFKLVGHVKSETAISGLVLDSSTIGERTLAPGPQALFVAACGVVVGDAAGVSKKLTEDAWVPPSLSAVFDYFDDRSGMAQYVLGLGAAVYSMNVKLRAVTQIGLVFNSYAALGGVVYGTSSAGFFYDAGKRIQDAYGYLPKEIMVIASKKNKIPLSQLFGVATFYAQFRLKRRGRHLIRICDGTACHVRGAPKMVQAIENALKVQPGDTSPDYKYTLELVYCVGSCGLAPVAVVDEMVFGKTKPEPFVRQLKKLE